MNFSLRLLLIVMVTVTLFTGCDDEDTIVDPVQTESNFDLYVNEIMPKNATTIKDDQGVANDWFEVYNASDEDVNLKGFTLKYEYTDSGTPMKYEYEISEDKVISAKSFLVFWCVDGGGSTVMHTNFGLKAKKGGVISIIDTEGFEVDLFDYTQTDVTGGINDLSVARYPDGSETLKSFGTGQDLWATPGQSNLTEIAPPEIQTAFINEIMVKNETTIQDPNNNYSDWIEFYNEGDAELNLKGWKVKYEYDNSGTTETLEFIFDKGFKIAPKSWKLIWCEGTGSGDFANFDMKAKKGGVITLYDTAGEKVDFIDYNGTDLTTGTADISYARKNDGNGVWELRGDGYAKAVTPEASNHID